MTDRLLEIAIEWPKIKANALNVSVELAHQQDDYEQRKIMLVPADGWTGKNADDRKIAEQRAYLTDDTLIKIRAKISSLNEQAEALNLSMFALDAERRAIEWGISARLADALEAYSNGRNPGKNIVRTLAAKVTTDVIDDIPF
jgi:hypothetical protein